MSQKSEEGTPADPAKKTRRPRLEPEAEEMRRLGYRLVDLSVDYLEGLSEQPVARRWSSEELRERLDEPLPRSGRGVEDSLDRLEATLLETLTRVNHPRFHGFIPSPSSFQAMLGAWLATALNPFVGSWLGAAGMASLELTTIRWLAEAVGYPVDTAGLFTSGGSIANLTAVAAARARFGEEDTMARGRLYFSPQGHSSAEKAARTLGFPADALVRVPVDDFLRLDPQRLGEQVEADRKAGLLPFFVCANAGTTNTGSIDPLPEIAELCRAQGLWFHLDAAYGGFAALCEEGRRKLDGLSRADSLTLDPHKWLYAPMGVGCILVRDRTALEGAFVTTGEYLADVPRDEINFFEWGPELSRPGRALSVWLLLRSVGIEALARQIEHDLALARTAQSRIAEHPELEIVVPAELSIVTFRHRRREEESEEHRAARDLALIEQTLAQGEVLVSSTVIDGKTALRLVVANHRTTEDELDRSLAALMRCVSPETAGRGSGATTQAVHPEVSNRD